MSGSIVSGSIVSEIDVSAIGEDIPLLEGLRTTRAIRRLKPDPVPIELVRKNEKIWKDNYKGVQLSDTEIIKAMIKNPRLIERPIVINHKKAIIGRPPANILSII